MTAELDAPVLEALAAKYREMIALRSEDGPKDDARLRVLATRFPGVLRELDTRTMASLEARLAEIDRALAGGATPTWASPQIRFHGWLRVALRLRTDGIDGTQARAWLDAYVPRDVGEPTREELEAHVSALLAPPKGRISLAAKRALTVPADVDLDELLFGVR